MSRQEFLQRLRDALTGEVQGNVIEENIRYYDEYIRTEASRGATEEEVIDSIGDPRLIARTIIDASEDAGDESYGGRDYDSFNRSGQTIYEEESRSSRNFHYVDLNTWYWKLLAAVVIVLFFFLIFSIISGIFAILVPLMGPILLILLVLWFLCGIRR